MKLTAFVGVLAIGAGAGLGYALHQRDLLLSGGPQASPEPGKSGGPRPSRRPRDPAMRLPPLTQQEELTLADAKRFIATARFEEARELTASTRLPTSASPSLRAATRVLNERATLFAVLTREIRPHPFSNATDLVEVTLPEQKTFVARIIKETDETVTFVLPDSQQREVHQERVLKRARITAQGWGAKQREDLERRKAALDDPDALEVFLLAYDAFRLGFPDMGVPLLDLSLSLENGFAIVDAYGAGDLALLHRAQERLRAERGSPKSASGALALSPRVPRPAPSTDVGGSPAARPSTAPSAEPSPVDVVDPEPEAPAAKTDLDRLEADSHWRDARKAYAEAIGLYKDNFAGTSPKEKEGLRKATTLLENARKLLDQLPQNMGDANQTIDTFGARVNSILRDVKKRKMATGS